MKSPNRPALLYYAAAIWFLLLLFWPVASNDLSEVQENSKSLSREDLYRSNLTEANFGLLGVRFYETVDGQPRWQIESQFAELHRRDNYSFLKNVTASFFSEATRNKILTKADYGRSWSDKNYIELDGNVSIESSRGYFFSMNHLNYDGKKHEFSSEDTVQMKGPNVHKPMMFLQGTGFNAQINKEHFILNRNVSSQKKLKSGEWLRVFSKSGEFFTNESRAVFLGGVKSNLPDLFISSDVFEVSSEQDQEDVKAFGNVVLKTKGKIGYAQKAYLEIGGNEIILEGKARIEADKNIIEGKRIKLYSDDDKIEVEEAEGRTVNEAAR